MGAQRVVDGSGLGDDGAGLVEDLPGGVAKLSGRQSQRCGDPAGQASTDRLKVVRLAVVVFDEGDHDPVGPGCPQHLRQHLDDDPSLLVDKARTGLLGHRVGQDAGRGQQGWPDSVPWIRGRLRP
jgi:hypothetical protein